MLPDWLPPVASQMSQGLLVTGQIALVSIASSCVLGLTLGLLLPLKVGVLRGLIGAYIELWRGLPVIVTLFPPEVGPEAGAIVEMVGTTT